MKEFFEALSILQQTLFVVGVVFTIIGLVQTLLSFIGGDTDADLEIETDVELDGDGDGSTSVLGAIINIRNIVSLAIGLSWGGLYFIEEGLSVFWAIVFGVLIGIVLMALNILLLWGLSKLRDPGQVFNYNAAIGKEGKVSIIIPKKAEGAGKISIVFQGRLQEIDAMTNEETDLKRGDEVIVTDVEGSIFIVINKNNL
jgi:membrane protein implicated in regulation of membrane protease activity